jgi:hypothetical protein
MVTRKVCNPSLAGLHGATPQVRKAYLSAPLFSSRYKEKAFAWEFFNKNIAARAWKIFSFEQKTSCINFKVF